MDPSPTYSSTYSDLGCPTLVNTWVSTLYIVTGTPNKGICSHERTDQAQKIELSDEGIANLSDAQFKILVIRMLTEVVGYGRKRRKSEGYAK